VSSEDNKIYRNRRPLRTIAVTVLALLLVLIVLAVCVFFGFRRYIVYTDDGVRLEVPWLQDSSQSGSSAAGFRLLF